MGELGVYTRIYKRGERGKKEKKKKVQTLSTILHSCVARRSCCLLPIKGSMTKCSRISNSRVLARSNELLERMKGDEKGTCHCCQSACNPRPVADFFPSPAVTLSMLKSQWG